MAHLQDISFSTFTQIKHNWVSLNVVVLIFHHYIGNILEKWICNNISASIRIFSFFFWRSFRRSRAVFRDWSNFVKESLFKEKKYIWNCSYHFIAVWRSDTELLFLLKVCPLNHINLIYVNLLCINHKFKAVVTFYQKLFIIVFCPSLANFDGALSI